jgi:hypothetical protein
MFLSQPLGVLQLYKRGTGEFIDLCPNTNSMLNMSSNYVIGNLLKFYASIVLVGACRR